MRDDQKFAKLTQQYNDYEEKVREYRDRFSTLLWNGQVIRKATKFFTPVEIKKIEVMEKKLANIRKEWLKELNRR